MKTKADGFVTYERLGKKCHHMLALGYTIEVVLENRLGDGYISFYRENDTTIVVPFTEFNVSDEVEIEYNELGVIKREF